MVSWSNLEKLCSCSRTWTVSALACGNKWIQVGTYSGRHLLIFYHAAKRAIRAGKPISDQGYLLRSTGFVYTRWTAIYVLQKNNKQGEVAHVENWNQRKWGYPGPDLGFWRVLMTHVLTKFMQGIILSNTQIT